MKKFYIAAWILLAATVLVSVFTGAFNPASMFAYSLVALGLVYTLAIWSIVVNTREIETG